MKKTTVYLTEALQRALEEAASAENKPRAELIRTALQEYLERRERPSLRSLGSGEDEELSGADSEKWIEAEWGRLRALDTRGLPRLSTVGMKITSVPRWPS